MKLTSQELRLGNWIQYSLLADEDYEGEQIQVQELPIADDCSAWGIPLTPELLVRMGFEKGVIYYQLGKFHIQIPNEYNQHQPKGRVYYNSWAIMEKMPEYVHQLQNLYFCLEGQELEIN